MNLAGLEQRYPSQLSGGQQQRVALARSLVVEPGILLLDEPLSNLDAKLRERMRWELKELQRRTGITFVYVTHDQSEAMALSDRIAVMHQGELQQSGRRARSTRGRPTKTVADFMGLVNLLPARVRPRVGRREHGRRSAGGHAVALALRPGAARGPGRADGDPPGEHPPGAGTLPAARRPTPFPPRWRRSRSSATSPTVT